MKAFTIEWHERCLKNMERSLRDRLLTIEQDQVSAGKLKDRIVRLSAQIARATAEGRDKFDGDRFNIPRIKT